MILQFGALFSGLGSSLIQQGLSFGTSFLEEKLGKKRRRRRRRRRRDPPEDEGVQAGQRISFQKPRVPPAIATAGIVPQSAGLGGEFARRAAQLARDIAFGVGVSAEVVGGQKGPMLPSFPMIGPSFLPTPTGGGRMAHDGTMSMSQIERARQLKQKYAVNPTNGNLQTVDALLQQGIIAKPPFFKIRCSKTTGECKFVKVKRRRMNPLNFRALMRANRRVEGFEGIIKRNFTFSKPATPKSRKRVVRRRKKRKAVC